ncbi:FAD-dependent dehydrogenase [Thermosulfidibacter takaii ABI70S6]|uniref:FAD-dependent dehydrogenase n=1 Tax=Thermosulfidibacter takaii (strain DSM 17441 / JCM 13301 / NBRC 103674 / ABI70S6) TaxID=1298851 RepID=A0A0S3QU97_THET7|nr:FAD-dependent monooxygenase [Thermosulfidibacter takaii]BAT71889.1 FAD-dependent dehydrogenase [Thermosulfidibacter takaii ABI70S6]
MTLLELRQIKVPFIKDSSQFLRAKVARLLGVKPQDINKLVCLKKSIDARQKDKMIYFVYNVLAELKRDIPIPKNALPYKPPEELKLSKVNKKIKPLVVGSGPCGLFAAIALAEAGIKGVLIERGCPVEERIKKVESLWKEGILDETCNPQFGEGGAGTFSDGKLTTRVRDPRIGWIFKKLVEFGAPEEILYDAKPHVGTDRLRTVVKNASKFLLNAGWDIHFRTKLEKIEVERDRLKKVKVNGDWIVPDLVVLAVGHSARDTYRMLMGNGITVVPKPFAVGFRVEHPQSLIDEAQYGKWAGDERLPPATYQLAYTFKEEKRGVYTFCMCPGGYVICASSSSGKLVVNGMSYFSRNSGFANAAVVVSVDERDFQEGVLGGIIFQEQIEEKAYQVAGGFIAPAMRIPKFLGLKIDSDTIVSTYRPGVVEHDVSKLYPEYLVKFLKKGLRIFGKKIRGFDSVGVIVAPETRTSAPVRIVRDETFQAMGVEGLYPAGEGAGYAGGIVSSALDGLKVAEAIIEKYS